MNLARVGTATSLDVASHAGLVWKRHGTPALKFRIFEDLDRLRRRCYPAPQPLLSIT